MYRPPYPRPFVRATSPVRSRSAAAVTLRRRLPALVRGHRRALTAAAGLSVMLHCALWLGWRSSDREYRPSPLIGYEGPIRVVDIVVLETQADQEHLAEERRRSGALVATEILTTEREIARGEPPAPSPLASVAAPDEPVAYYVVEAPPARVHPAPDEPIRVHLREDFTVDPASPLAPFALDIHPVWIVRPDYPDYARREGIEGLVRLEAEVGITGKVLDVHVLEAPDGVLALAASRSLLLWEFKPLEVGGELRRYRVVVPFRFRLIS